MSAWCVANQLVLGQEKVYEQSTEITAIPCLLDQLDLQDKIITIDTMGTQREICENGGDYVLALKGNQPSLLEDTKIFFERIKNLEKKLENYVERDKGHGRIEKRHAFVLKD